MSFVASMIERVPEPARGFLVRHRELVKFGIVGGTTFVIDNVIYFSLAFTILAPKPTTAKVIAVLVATIASYILNREWSFRNRGGRERHHEATLFFLVSGIGIAINATPIYMAHHWFGLNAENLSTPLLAASDFWWGSIFGMLLAMFFRWWAFRKFVFPEQHISGPIGAAELLAEAEDQLATGSLHDDTGDADDEYRDGLGHA